MQTENNQTVPMEEHGIRQPKTDNIHLRDSAWIFAHTILWPDQKFHYEETERAKCFILAYFRDAYDVRRAFTNFCERIILAQKITLVQPDGYIPNPTVWFNKQYEKGFADTKVWLDQVHNKRLELPNYLKHISVMANHYYKYCQRPSSKTFHSCRKKLMRLNANKLLQQFYNTIVHFNYSR